VDKTGFVKDFYSRQVVMRELGEVGQQKLASSRVAVVGVGGLGTVSALYLV
jgi:molybdopterin/thiamine biosynthesis adenylyltransferase